MTLYENPSDTMKEGWLIQRVQAWMQRQISPKIVCAQTSSRISYDFSISIGTSGDYIGIGEVKSRQYTRRFFEENGWVMEDQRINSLQQLMPQGGMFMLVLHTSDDWMFAVSNKKLLPARPNLKACEPKHMTDDHGKKATDKTGFIIPFELLTSIPEQP
jgi:hypothetical protein